MTIAEKVLQKFMKKHMEDTVYFLSVYGLSVVVNVKRPWWNPMRYIKGKYKYTHIAPKAFYLDMDKK